MTETSCDKRGHIMSPVSPRCGVCGVFSSQMMLVTREVHDVLTARLAAAEAALREIDRLERAEMFERCPDCDYPDECSRECGCRIVERKGTAVQQVVWRIIGREVKGGMND